MTRKEWTNLKVGDKVQARITVYDLPPDTRWTHADPGDVGTVVHAEPGHRTVQFQPRGTITDVSPEEVDIHDSTNQ